MRLGLACPHSPRTAHTVRRRLVWYDIIALGVHTWLNDIGCGMSSYLLESTHDHPTPDVSCYHRPMTFKHRQMMSWVACHQGPWTSHTVRLCRALPTIIALGQNTLPDNIRRGMLEYPLDNTHSLTTLRVACHHIPWTAHTIGQRGLCNVIIFIGQYTQLDKELRGMSS